ncbi:SDR family NAD(P)-dependent oxidoreductase [Sandaracinobacteroides saxicola]|uniref:SDR family NAD(P)-dependent oxidoreductase n=1 Tax=Sandaracinobacteroides saxicola TaxID=2759707 RepID=UPI001FB09DAD|nr:SDR family NAD(P)-dependent oxidoreductase [Sandaracinobacteroides saxicola]
MTAWAIVGASGGVGGALADVIAATGAPVVRLSRRTGLDLTDEGSIAAAFAPLADLAGVIVATGLLHREDRQPERDWRQLDAAWMAENFAINTIGPALVAKHALPKLRRGDPSVFAALSARVGSIADNRLGGWHSYRASKVALNMLVRTLAIELARKNPAAVAVTLHPGTVDTGLSKPFQRNVAPEKLFTPAHSAAQLWRVIQGLTREDNGFALAWDGQRIPF